MRSTLNGVMHVQRTTCWRCCPSKDQLVGLLFLSARKSSLAKQKRVCAHWNHIHRELKRRRHPRPLYSWCTRRTVENEWSARRNLLAFLRENRTTCVTLCVKLDLEIRLHPFSCAEEGRARTYLKLGKDLQFWKPSLVTTVLIISNGRLDQRGWF